MRRWVLIGTGPSVNGLGGYGRSGEARRARPCRTLNGRMSTQIPIRELPASPVSAAEVAPVRRPVDQARLLPPRVFHDRDVFEFEQERWFARTWLCVGREEDVGAPGTYLLVRVAGESVAIIRDRSGAVRAFHNVCRHRGSTLVDEPPTAAGAASSCASSARITPGSTTSTGRSDARRTPTSWSTSTRPTTVCCRSRLDTWAGFVFVNLDPGRRARSPTTWPTFPPRSPTTRSAACAARGASSTTSAPTGRSSARTTPSATTAPASIRSSTG